MDYREVFEWTDCQGHPENALSRAGTYRQRDVLLAAGHRCIVSAIVLGELWDGNFGGGAERQVTLSTGCSIFPKGVATPRRWAQQRYPNIVYWNELDRGGHFAAFEQPELFVQELRACFRDMVL